MSRPHPGRSKWRTPEFKEGAREDATRLLAFSPLLEASAGGAHGVSAPWGCGARGESPRKARRMRTLRACTCWSASTCSDRAGLHSPRHPSCGPLMKGPHLALRKRNGKKNGFTVGARRLLFGSFHGEDHRSVSLGGCSLRTRRLRTETCPLTPRPQRLPTPA